MDSNQIYNQRSLGNVPREQRTLEVCRVYWKRDSDDAYYYCPPSIANKLQREEK